MSILKLSDLKHTDRGYILKIFILEIILYFVAAMLVNLFPENSIIYYGLNVLGELVSLLIILTLISMIFIVKKIYKI